MSIRSPLIAALAVAATVGAAQAGALKPIEARSIDLGTARAVAYYTVERDGFRVVTTLAQGESGAPVRFETLLAPGQSVVLSTPREAGANPTTVEISRQADSLIVREPRSNGF